MIICLLSGSDQFSAVMTDGKVHLSLNAGTSLDGLPPGGLISLLVQVQASVHCLFLRGVESFTISTINVSIHCSNNRFFDKLYEGSRAE